MRREATALCTLTLLLLALPLTAGEPVPVTPPAPAAPPTIPDLPENQAEIAAQAAGQLVLEPAAVASSPVVVTARSAEMVEIEQAITVERARVTELAARVHDLGDDAAALAVQVEIEQIKHETEFEILRIQAKHARLAGQEAKAAAIEADLARMMSPAAALPASPTGDVER